MRRLFLAASFPLLLGIASAQTIPIPQPQYNDAGDPLSWGNGAPAPGDVWSQISHAYSRTDGLAPYHGNLLVGRYSDGASLVFEIDPASGAEVNTYPVESDIDAWLGYDPTRDLILTANPSDDNLKGYSPGIAVPVFNLPSPVPGPIGVAYDSTRDEYAVCDWDGDQIWVVDASSLQTARIMPVTLTRMCGMAYDCRDDVYIVGDRDTNLHSFVDPDTGAIGLQYMTAGSLVSDPRGAALSNDGGVWTGDFTSEMLYEQEAAHPPMAVVCSGGSLGTNYCVSGDNSTGSPAVMSATGSDSVAANSLTLVSELVPNQPGLFFFGQQQAQLSFGNGFRCISGTVVRLPILNATGNSAVQTVDLTGAGISPGTWNFQHWFRDPAGGGAFFDLSDGLEIVFVP